MRGGGSGTGSLLYTREVERQRYFFFFFFFLVVAAKHDDEKEYSLTKREEDARLFVREATPGHSAHCVCVFRSLAHLLTYYLFYFILPSFLRINEHNIIAVNYSFYFWLLRDPN